MTTVHEIAVGCETVTAVIDLTNPYNEERLVGPLIVGHYYDNDLPAIIKQLKRVERLMKEQA